MTKPRIIFMGTPSFALPALEILHSNNYPIRGVITQPDRPQGRGKKIFAPPVKNLAQKYCLPVFQTENIKDHSFLDILKSLNPEIIVVAAFGKILPKAIIDLPSLGCLNIHPSLLPKYRGAAPINWAIIRGEIKTGVTIMLMDKGMDSGDILMQEETPIIEQETFGQLQNRMATQGALLLIKTIKQVIAGTVQRRPQDISQVTFAPRLNKETGHIKWQDNVLNIYNLIRGLNPSPAAYTLLDGQLLKIFTAKPKPGKVDKTPGKIGDQTAEGLGVAAADGYVILKEVQLAGKKRMPANEFFRGYRLKPETIFG
ncbi:MAG: methionyl-tRNA formyltransferase [Deltaproteobacteria bacterium RBG_19FT_COMBO_43_11]|nr:MAG: methionyl-tRNA formyltransferase [Deltaproteobacteria bacterium RBG_19FT_COMBO_43_11]